MPPEVNEPTIYIITPNGTSNVPNPLYTYAFHPLPSSTDFPPIGSSPGVPQVWSLPNTVRYPDSAGQSQPDLVDKQLQANGASLHSLTYQLLTQQPNYGIFSNTRYNDGRDTGRYNSIENMHNAIHMLVGNGGHMSNIPYSSFDPIFWLHHANTDRLFALWQAVYLDSHFTSQISAFPTYTTDAGKTEDATTPKLKRQNPPQRVIQSNKKHVEALSIRNRAQVSKSDSSSPFFVHLYLGPAPADPTTWSFAPNLIASHSVVDSSLLSTADTGLPTTLYGQIPLNHALLAAGDSDLASSKVVPLLTSQLNWRLQTTDDAPLDISKVPSLKIHVVGQEVKPRVSEDEFPEYGHLAVYREVTKGKAGGLQDGDDTE
ncbi:MAG: hypothetical protein L6R40_008111 [Gallowayella cf. fulva]|nr:MAG: hypothetical protein L6R40_008111 [Xanthomendoza cf. fulva]